MTLNKALETTNNELERRCDNFEVIFISDLFRIKFKYLLILI